MLYLSLRPLRTGTTPSSIVGVAPVFSHVRLSASTSHNNYANLCTRPGGGSEAPLRGSYLLCGPAAATPVAKRRPS